MLLRVCAWLTLVFLLSVVFVAVASAVGWLPALADIGRSGVGIELSLFWLLGLLAMLVHIAAALLDMVRAHHWGWLFGSFILAPFTTLYYFWFIKPK